MVSTCLWYTKRERGLRSTTYGALTLEKGEGLGVYDPLSSHILAVPSLVAKITYMHLAVLMLRGVVARLIARLI